MICRTVRPIKRAGQVRRTCDERPQLTASRLSIGAIGRSSPVVYLFAIK